MKAIAWLTVIANLLAHGWTLLVFFATGKVFLDEVVLISADDTLVLIALEAIAALFTVILAIKLLAWQPTHVGSAPGGSPASRPVPAAPSPSRPGPFAVRVGRPPIVNDNDPRIICPACRKENQRSAKHCAWCGTRLR